MKKWSVCIYNVNKKEFEWFNIFKHVGFAEDVKKIFQKYRKGEDRKGFQEEITRSLRYYFWSKSEYELLINKMDDKIIANPWMGDRNKTTDLTNDDNFNWLKFYEWIAYKKYATDGVIKIDVYDQVIFQSDTFFTYCWNECHKTNNK